MRTNRWRIVPVVLALAWLALAWHHPGAPGPSAATADSTPLSVEVEGCPLLINRRVCVRPPSKYPTKCEASLMRAGAPEDGFHLRIRVAANASADLSLFQDGEAIDAVPGWKDGELHWTVLVSASARRLSLRSHRDPGVRWSIDIAHPPAEPPALRRAREVRATSQGKGKRAAQARLRSIDKLERIVPALDPQVQAVAFEVLAELQYLGAKHTDDRGERKEIYRRAQVHAGHAVELLERLDDPARASFNMRRALHVSGELLHDDDGAESWYRRLRSLRNVPARARLANALHEGRHLQRTGQPQAAIEAYERMEAAGRYESLAQHAGLLAFLGRVDEAKSLLLRVDEHVDAMRCQDWLRILTSMAWARIQLGEQGIDMGDPLPELYDVLMLLRKWGETDGGCYDANLEPNALINAALAEIAEGHVGQAQLQLDRFLLLSTPLDPVEDWEFDEYRELIELRSRLGLADTAALSEWMMVHASSGRGPRRPDSRWRRSYWRGEAYQALGLQPDAMRAYMDAEGALEDLMQELSFDVAREALLLGRQPSAGRLVELLVDADRWDEALCFARRARGRMDHVLDRNALVAALPPARIRDWEDAIMEVHSLHGSLDKQEQSEWEVPSEKLGAHRAKVAQTRERLGQATDALFEVLHSDPSSVSADERCQFRQVPASGSVHVLYFPLERKLDRSRWMGFAFDETGVIEATRIGPLPEVDDVAKWDTDTLEIWADALLEPLAGSLQAARDIAVLPMGPLWSVPFAALPFGEGILLEHMPVTLSLDLTRLRTGGPGTASRPKRALVIGSPHGDLPEAESEALFVHDALDARGWPVVTLVREDATVDTVRGALADATLLHYAGHGYRGGVEGWDSRLSLAADGDLDVHDVLALPRVPTSVVLLACDATPGSERSLGGGMSLARAFLLAGTDLVLASDGELDDRLAKRVAEEIYDHGVPLAGKGAEIVQQALLAVRKAEPPQTEWWKVRVLLP